MARTRTTRVIILDLGSINDATMSGPLLMKNATSSILKLILPKLWRNFEEQVSELRTKFEFSPCNSSANLSELNWVLYVHIWVDFSAPTRAQNLVIYYWKFQENLSFFAEIWVEFQFRHCENLVKILHGNWAIVFTGKWLQAHVILYIYCILNLKQCSGSISILRCAYRTAHPPLLFVQGSMSGGQVWL